ncbi:MAG TPA: urease accessory UreF family protein, partial [Ilumatobacter sp.]|nr:urease accessory UreF family protein [Ilumatobacter sp.]
AIVDAASLERYLFARLATSGVTDAAFAARTAALGPCYPALAGPAPVDLAAVELAVLDELDAEFTARIASSRQRQISRQLGRQLARGTSAVWPSPVLQAVAGHPAGPHQPIVLGAATAAAGGTPADAAVIAFHHLAAAVTTAAIRLLGLDPIAVAVVQARGAQLAQRLAADAGAWSRTEPRDLPARSGALTEILSEDHGRWDARLFVA